MLQTPPAFQQNCHLGRINLNKIFCRVRWCGILYILYIFRLQKIFRNTLGPELPNNRYMLKVTVSWECVRQRRGSTINKDWIYRNHNRWLAARTRICIFSLYSVQNKLCIYWPNVLKLVIRRNRQTVHSIQYNIFFSYLILPMGLTVVYSLFSDTLPLNSWGRTQIGDDGSDKVTK